MIYILKDIGKGKIGFGERQITKDNLFRLDKDYNVDTNYYVNSATFSDGTITLTRNDGTPITIPMDGRYLQSFTEQDPTVPQHVKNITTNHISNWNNGYYDDITNLQLSRLGDDLIITMFKRNGDTISQQIKLFVNNITEIPNRSYNDLQDKPILNLSDWNTAFGWGDHSQQGYITGLTNITEIPNRSYNDLQDLPDINSEISFVDKNASTDKHVIASVSSHDISETVTRLNTPVLNGNVLTLKFINENNVEQTVSVDLSTVVTNESGINNATYDAATNVITLTEEDGDTWTIDLSEFSIVPNTDEFGVTTLTQEFEVKLTVSKVGQTGQFSDLLNKPTTIAGYGLTDAYTITKLNNFFGGSESITGYNKSDWDVAYSWGNHALQGYLTEYQNIAWNGTTGNFTITNGNTINLDGRYALINSLTPLATNGISVQDVNGNEQFLSTGPLKFGNVIFDPENSTISVPEVPPQILSWNGNVSGNLTISDGNTVNLDDRYSRNPKGLEGQLYFIDKDGTNQIIPDYLMKRGIIVETQAEFDSAVVEGFSLDEVFRTWDLFSHYFGTSSEEQSPESFPAFNPNDPEPSTALTPEEFYDKTAWGYDDVNERIYLTKNYDPYTGFISPKEYSNYLFEATLSSTNNDDDQMGLVIGFYKDPTSGFEYTLSVLRMLTQASNQGDYTYILVYNYGQNLSNSPHYKPEYADSSQNIIIDGTALAPFPAGATGWVGNDTRLRVDRNGDVFSIKTSQFGSTVIDDTTEIIIDLNNYPTLSMFKGQSKVGFSAKSQKDAYFSEISFDGFVNYIFYNQNDGASYQTWEYDQTTQQYLLQDPKTTYVGGYFGISRFVYSYLFKKVYYINEDNSIIKIAGGLVSDEDFSSHISDNTNPHNVTAEQIGLGNVDNTADIDKVVSTPQREEFDRVEALIPTDNNQLANGAGYLEEVNHDTGIRAIRIQQSDLPSYDTSKAGLLEYLNTVGFTKGDMENILFEIDLFSSAPNTYIGGVASYIPDSQTLANLFNVNINTITHFEVIGDDIVVSIQEDYKIDGFNPYHDGAPNTLTYFINTDGKCTSIGSRGLAGQSNIKTLHFPNIKSIGASSSSSLNSSEASDGILSLPVLTTVGPFAFNNHREGYNHFYLGSLTSAYDTSISNYNYNNRDKRHRIYVPPSMVDHPMMNDPKSRGATIIGIQNYTKPSAINDLTITNNTGTSVDVNFSTPSSTNTIDHYEVFVYDGTIVSEYSRKAEILASGSTVEIDTNTQSVKVRVVDMYYNKSEFSNIVIL
jgi:hypothetical protein